MEKKLFPTLGLDPNYSVEIASHLLRHRFCLIVAYFVA